MSTLLSAFGSLSNFSKHVHFLVESPHILWALCWEHSCHFCVCSKTWLIMSWLWCLYLWYLYFYSSLELQRCLGIYIVLYKQRQARYHSIIPFYEHCNVAYVYVSCYLLFLSWNLFIACNDYWVDLVAYSLLWMV